MVIVPDPPVRHERRLRDVSAGWSCISAGGGAPVVAGVLERGDAPAEVVPAKQVHSTLRGAGFVQIGEGEATPEPGDLAPYEVDGLREHPVLAHPSAEAVLGRVDGDSTDEQALSTCHDKRT